MIKSKRFNVFWSLARLTRSLRMVSSRAPLILEESIITFLDCRRARLRLRRIFLGLLVNGDLISYSIPSSKMSAVLDERVGKNSTVCPAYVCSGRCVRARRYGAHLLGLRPPSRMSSQTHEALAASIAAHALRGGREGTKQGPN